MSKGKHSREKADTLAEPRKLHLYDEVMANLVRQDFPDLQRRVLAVKELADGTIGVVEFDDHEDPNALGFVSVARFRLVRRSGS